MTRPPTKPANRTRETSTKAIDPSLLYRADSVRRLLDWRESAWRAAVKRGLPIFKAGRRHYVRGSDLIAFLTRQENLVEAAS